MAWQRYSLTKESIPSGCLSVSLVCPSVSFFMPFYYKPNVLESICDRSLTEAPSSPSSTPSEPQGPIYPRSECKYKSRKKKKKGDNPSKEDLAVINVAYFLVFQKSKNLFLEQKSSRVERSSPQKNHGWRRQKLFFHICKPPSLPPLIFPGCLV